MHIHLYNLYMYMLITQLSLLYRCDECADGYTGDSCEQTDYCFDHACQNGATCVNGQSDYDCTCPRCEPAPHCSCVACRFRDIHPCLPPQLIRPTTTLATAVRSATRVTRTSLTATTASVGTSVHRVTCVTAKPTSRATTATNACQGETESAVHHVT